MRNKCVLLIVGVLFSSVLRGDIAPTTYDGYTLTTKESSDIRMKSEEVDLYWGDRIRVSAKFEMVNETDKPIDLFIGFPVEHGTWRREGLYDFQVRINEESNLQQVKLLPEEVQLQSYTFIRRMWFGWDQSFPPGRTVARVEYHVEPFLTKWGNQLYQNVLYILDTGALWKGAIGQADIRVHFAEPVAAEQIREGTWPRGWWIDGNDLCWRFKDFEPQVKDNIQIDYMPLDIYHELQRLRKSIAENPQDETRVIELARRYFSLGDGIHGPPPLLCPEYDSILAKISEPNDRAEFKKFWEKTSELPIFDWKSRSEWASTRFTEADLPRQWTVVHAAAEAELSPRIVRIMSSAGYPPTEPSEYGIQAQKMLERLLEKNPKNADAWLVYLENCYQFLYGVYLPKSRSLGSPQILPPKQKEIIERAYAQCPTNGGIRAWHDLVVSQTEK